MKISIENLGIISEAKVEVDGITLIAGPNDSGKSTIGKVFYSIVRGFNPDETVFNNEKNERIRNYYQNILRILRENKDIEISKFQTNKINIEWTTEVRSIVDNYDLTQKSRLLSYTKALEREFDIEFNSTTNRSREINDFFEREFDDEIQSVFFPEKIARILLEDIEGSVTLEYNEDFSYFSLNKNLNTFFNNSFFIESPSIIDKSLQNSVIFESQISRDKKTQLKLALANESSNLIFNENFENYLSKIISIISEIISGELIIDDFNSVIYNKNGYEINIDNVALGIKGFGLIQLLLRNKQLNERTLLIIDEPEIHLHPNWQVLYAEILVLLSKKLEIPILLTSHSPYFIEALKAYSEKYDFVKKTKFYFTLKSEDNLRSRLLDVSEDISPILVSISEAHFKISDIEND